MGGDARAGGRVLAVLHGHTHLTVETALAGVKVLGLRSTHFSFAQAGDEWLYVLRPPQYRVVTVAGDALSSEGVEVALWGLTRVWAGDGGKIGA